MDKLQPIIKHHYWVCFGFAVIFALTGWWMASGSIAEATDQRRSSVNESFTKSEKSQANAVPNQRWIDGAKVMNEKDQVAYDHSSRQLWERQKAARVWHPKVAQQMAAIPYFEMIDDTLTRVTWGEYYKTQFEEILKIVQPFDQKEGTGLVLVNPNRISHERFDKWRGKTPLTEEVWRNQEDLWLTKEVLEAIAATNSGASRISEAAIPEIVQLRFRGGDRNAPAPSAGGGAGSGFGGSPDGGLGGAFGGAMGAGGEAAYGGYSGGAAESGPWKAFAGSFGGDILGEEFGRVAGAGGGFSGGGGEDEYGGGGAGTSSFGGSQGFTGPGGGGAAASAEPEDRYVDDEDGLGYKTRAFLLHVKIRESDIPALLASLTNSDFPVEIVRVDFNAFAGGSLSMGGGDMLSGPMGGEGDGGDLALGGGEGEYGGYGGYGAYGGDTGSGTDDGSYDPGDIGGSGGGEGEPMGEGPGVGGYGGYGMSGRGYGGIAGPTFNTTQEMLSAAMGNPYLRELRIGGLMTLYQSREESNAESATEAAAAEEAAESEAAPPVVPEGTESDAGDANPSGEPTESTSDPAAPQDAAADNSTPAGEQPENTADPATDGQPATVTPAAEPGVPAAGDAEGGGPATDQPADAGSTQGSTEPNTGADE